MAKNRIFDKSKICHRFFRQMVYTKEKMVGGISMHEPRKHYRVALREIKETPDSGVYLTKEELRKYGIFAGVVFLIMAFFAVFDRKD